MPKTVNSLLEEEVISFYKRAKTRHFFGEVTGHFYSVQELQVVLNRSRWFFFTPINMHFVLYEIVSRLENFLSR